VAFSDHDCHKLIQDLPEALFLEDMDGNILDVNQQACEILGYDREELLEMGVDEIVPDGAPLYLPDKVDVSTESCDPIETVNIRKNGSEVPIELRGKVLEVDEEKKILVSIRDISQRKEKDRALRESEEKYRTIFESANDAIFLMKDGKFVDCNRKTLEIFGCSREDIIGRPPWEFSPERQPDGMNSRKESE